MEVPRTLATWLLGIAAAVLAAGQVGCADEAEDVRLARCRTAPLASDLPIGADCCEDSECSTGICWQIHSWDPGCIGAICSISCTADADCVSVADQLGETSAASALCDESDRCNLVAGGVDGEFVCEF